MSDLATMPIIELVKEIRNRTQEMDGSQLVLILFLNTIANRFEQECILKPLTKMLEDCDQELADMVSDEMDKADERGEVSPGHAFCVAEDAAPELDEARSHVQEAIAIIEKWERENEL